jgi:predicted nucleic acid-binding protein
MSKKKRAGQGKTARFVLDSSITLAWAFKDETDAYAEAVADSLPAKQAVVSALWPLEVANALLAGERRKRITEAKVAQFLALLESFPITLDEETAGRAWQDTLHLARSHELSVYDATYLELALRLGLPLASLDDKLKAAAASTGVPEFKP